MSKPLVRLIYLAVVLMLIYTIAPALPRKRAAFLNLLQESLRRSDEKVIEKDPYDNEPVEIENLSVKNIKIALHQKFSAKTLAEQGGGVEEDWLENLEFAVRNKSDKRVTYLGISLRFPRIGNPDRSVGMFHHFAFGVDLRASGQAATYAEPFSLDPGAAHSIRLSEKGLKEIKSLVSFSKNSLADFNTVYLRISVVGYEDGLQWMAGKYSVPEKHKRSDNKVIEKAWQDKAPYEISDLSVKNVKITSRERLVDSGFTKVRKDSYEFSAESIAKNGGGLEEDWLENLEFTIKNKSDKQITYIGLSILFPETKINGPMMVSNLLQLGINPKISAEHRKQSTPFVLATGDKITFRLSAQRLKQINDFLHNRKFQLAELNKAEISVVLLAFEDGIIWSAGRYLRPSSSAPGGYERIGDQ